MTSAQRKRYYFPAWQKCAAALGWRMRKARLEADLPTQYAQAEAETGHSALCNPHSAIACSPGWDMRLQVIAIAQSVARQSHRAVTADDLRHACNLVAADGKATSSDRLTHRQITRAVQLFNLLADPDDLAAVNAWLHPEDAERLDLIRYMERRPAKILAAYRAIADNRWGSIDWKTRGLDDLRWLHRTATQR